MARTCATALCHFDLKMAPFSSLDGLEDIFANLLRALNQQERLWITYEPPGTPGIVDYFHPYHIAFMRDGWYVFGHSEVLDEVRAFKTDRISACSSTGQTFVIEHPNDVTLPESARATLKGYLQLLDHVRRQVAGATREFRKQVNRSPDARHLLTIPGISWILGYTIMAEIGRIERFPSARHLASYSLLAPIAHDSGDETDETPQGRHVGFVGRRTLKWAWIEAAHGAVCSGGRWRQIFDRRTNAGKRDRNRGYIAVAHDLCRVAYVCWSKHVDYTETPPGRPGSTTSKSIERQERTNRRRNPGQRQASARIKVSASSSREFRPGTGQPDPAMVAVVDRRP